MNRQPAFYGEFLVDVLLGRAQTASYHPGGAPANSAASAAGSGARPLLFSSVGADRLGSWLLSCAEAEGIDTQAIKVMENAATSIAFGYPERGTTERFEFIRDADLRITDEQVLAVDPAEIGVLVFGSLSLAGESPMVSSLALVQDRVRSSGGLVMCDLNYRKSLWGSEHQFTKLLKPEVARADIVKANIVEAELIVGSADSAAGLAARLSDLGPRLAVVTAGSAGLVACAGDVTVDLKVTRQLSGDGLVGTGDALVGVLASAVSRDGLEAITATAERLTAVLREGMLKAEAGASVEGADWRHVADL
ncbi:PfkB family carbohydrate kinase [Amycolatopsis sp. FBCC-B4732]|uniref:PfkB family carbohydrate kinase n=1 Tax=Amycolatopsis sp. FBCC-B4732 TaxID=3079339 RepID=UPI001FF2E82C|nr:PfkB family carbohydrate kinase [Amycolatopsis sp. FBCC-B4732]UOX87629.1 PfkB family carbohydrate kinase [Amycolatopsis sp. FBCC-B4732]